MGSGESRDEFEYIGFSNGNPRNWVSLHFGHYGQDLKHLIGRLIENPNDCRLIDKKRSAYLWELKHASEYYEVYFSKINFRGWNFALEIAGPDPKLLVHLESYIISILVQTGAEMSQRICEEDEYHESDINYSKYYVY